MMYVFMHPPSSPASVPTQPKPIPTNRPNFRRADTVDGYPTPPDSQLSSPTRPSPLTPAEGEARTERARLQFLAMLGSR